ncbi:SGNH/GDSL hydrolase family protein [Alteromonas sp. C1M14]|uniref:SGNH/GDSL hydrolase family protein n=1 Tax=Alteromonas sp. C1M14 TaxID=2841567 RepID=UPI001C08167A|nr:SGNH/GDSL hydrolase family protein [Alteromonas sp. C1M14]MBU2978998.1 SGNH/GDSL hydrolase family protein [Alteromonas sp. C1M14]
MATIREDLTSAEFEAAISKATQIARGEATIPEGSVPSGVIDTIAEVTEAASAADSKAVTAKDTADAVKEQADGVSAITSAAPSAAGFLLSKLKNNLSDACVFMCSDSTGNAPDESLYLITQWYAAQFQEYTVLYYLWDTGTNAYLSAETIQTGTGDNTLKVYNAAINGSRPNYILGEFFDDAVKSIPKADLIIYNHGHNLGHSGTWDTTNPLDGRTQLMLAGILSILEVHEGAGVIFSGQNPRRDDDYADLMHAAIVQAAALIGADVTNSYERFMAVDKDVAYYEDNIHPNALGHSELIYPALVEKHYSTTGKSSDCSLLEERANLLVNGDFSALTSDEPDGWTLVNTVTSQDTANYESMNGYSIKLTWTGEGGSHNISQSIPAALVRRLWGRRVTLAARVFIPNGSPSTSPRVKIQTTGASATSRDDDQGHGGFVWKFISLDIPEDATFVQAVLIGDGSTTGGSPSFDRAIMTVGATAHDLAYA